MNSPIKPLIADRFDSEKRHASRAGLHSRHATPSALISFARAEFNARRVANRPVRTCTIDCITRLLFVRAHRHRQRGTIFFIDLAMKETASPI
jgi:hypothetical protein